jgi:hypothetical protein
VVIANHVQVWGTHVSPFSFANTPAGSVGQSAVQSRTGSIYNGVTEKGLHEDSTEILEDGLANAPKESLARPLVFTSSVYAGLAVFLIIVLLLGFGTSNLVGQSLVDGQYVRFALVATEPIFMLFSVFFAIVVFTNIFQTVGPIGSLKSNSRFFSAIKVSRSSIAFIQIIADVQPKAKSIILLCARVYPSTHNHPNASVQRVLGRCHHSYGHEFESCHLSLRAPWR